MGFSQNGWTTGTTLPGGDIENGDFVKFLTRCKQAYAWLDEAVLNDYARNYGSEIDRLLDGCSSIGDLGKDFGGVVRMRSSLSDEIRVGRNGRGYSLAPN
jgi:glycerol-3-phosphate dehydrogenase